MSYMPAAGLEICMCVNILVHKYALPCFAVVEVKSVLLEEADAVEYDETVTFVVRMPALLVVSSGEKSSILFAQVGDYIAVI